MHDFLCSLFDDVEVVCYFRDQFDLAVSLYSTALKIDSILDIDTFIDHAKPENYYYNYLKIADSWSEVFGRHRCNFRIYDRSRFAKNDIRFDFLEMLNSDVELSLLDMGRMSNNEALSLMQATAFKVINQKIPYWLPGKVGVNPANIIAKNKVLEIDSLKSGKIMSDKADLIRNRFSGVNNLFFEKYFTELNGFPVRPLDASGPIFSGDLISAIEGAFAAGLRINVRNAPALPEAQVKLLRDIALRLYHLNPNYIADALALMKIALQQRPHGPVIKNKVEQLSAIINSGRSK